MNPSFYLLDAGFKVCILDAAVLLEAEWDRACHEVWVSVVPPKEVSEALNDILQGASQEACAVEGSRLLSLTLYVHRH